MGREEAGDGLSWAMDPSSASPPIPGLDEAPRRGH